MLELLIEYCKDHPILSIILWGCLFCTIITLGICLFLIRDEDDTPKAKKSATVEKTVEQELPTEETQPTEQELPSEETQPVEVEQAKEELKIEEHTISEPVEEYVNQENADSSNVEEQTETLQEEYLSIQKKPRTKRKSKSKKESTMLLDELQDVDKAIDFYEEDETDQMARYKGKWVVCRLITRDDQAPEEEAYFFELHASNGEKLLASEEYTTYGGALRGIETYRTNILRGNLKITLSKKGDYIFKLLSGKNLLLCMGENYPTRARCESAIASTVRFAKTAILDENIQDHIVKLPVEDESDIQPLPDGYNGKWVVGTRQDLEENPVYFFELFASNGERLLASEEYSTYVGAVNGIQTHKRNIAENNFRITLTKRGDYIYKLMNKNGQLLCLGEHYRTKQRCLNAVESVKRFALNAPVLTEKNLTQQ